MKKLAVFAVVTPGLEAIAKQDLQTLGIPRPKAKEGGFSFRVSFAKLCELNLCSRVCSGFLVRLAHGYVSHFNELSRLVRNVDWTVFFRGVKTVQVKVTSKKSKLYHTGAIEQRVVQGIEKSIGHSLQVVTGRNLAPDTQCVVVRVMQNEFTCSISSSGAHLHRRGYRKFTAKAPIRENIAAGLLLALGYDGSQPLWDPMTGSGTFGIEGALIASNRPPGMFRRFAFMSWSQFNEAEWQILRQRKQKEQIQCPCVIVSSDRNQGAIAAARVNAKGAHVEGDIDFHQGSFSASAEAFTTTGVCILNPPYGDRIGGANLKHLYASFQASRSKTAKTGIVTSNMQLPTLQMLLR